ncbi:hypothetical protein PYR71_23600 [Rhizobium sp. MC63]|uniref:Uncharacterized protein n=1 Tax=Rhizobium mulingense TaxID=3031128 RepID=A0ACC6N483_9HYPH|nr:MULTISPECIES: hypothetical protein [unclassified Rhizobium]MDF0699434.1 hypothetical protein [Rhizobium sp. MC63]MEA3519751.1 hypothetical protein [Rhizobium sp. MJ31]
MNILDSNHGLDGHDQLAALMQTGIQPPIGETLVFALVELERGRVVFEERHLTRSSILSAQYMVVTLQRYSTAPAAVPLIRVSRQAKAIRRSN